MSLHVLNVCLLLSVQDRGQVGSHKFRVSVGGAMDAPPLALANTACDGLVHKTALISALNSRHLGCVALHFYSLTAPLGPLADCSNLLFIQQLNATTEEALSHVGYCVAGQVLTPLNGQIQETALNADFLIAAQKAC
jgi:phosphoglycerate dehydrogenase-like enzyme